MLPLKPSKNRRMPGGKGNIEPADNPKPWTSERQPTNHRKPDKFLTALLIKGLKEKSEIIIEGFDLVTNKPTKVRVPMPTQKTLVQALLRNAGKGNINHIREVFDRIEGKVTQPVDFSATGPLNIIFHLDKDSAPLNDE